MASKRFIILLLHTFLFLNQARAQEFPFRRYTIHDGLSAMQVTCLFQDSRGYIWAGTKVGLSKFNGVSFENFRKQPGLWNGHITDLEEDEQGNLLIGTRQGLLRFDGAHFDTLFVHSNIGLSFFHISSEEYWLNINDRLAHWDGADIQYPLLDYPGFEDTVLRAFYFDSKREQAFLFKEDGAYLFTPKPKAVAKLETARLLESNWKTTLPGHFIVSSTPDRELVVHDLTMDLKGVVLGVQGDSIYRHPSFGQVACFYMESEKKIFCAGELLGRTTHWSQQMLEPVIEMLLDREGNLWIATEQGVLQQFSHAFQNYSLSHLSNIWDIEEDKNGNIWFVGYKQGLTRYNGQDYEPISGYEQWLPGKELYMGALCDQSGDLFFPTDNSILKYDGQQFHLFANANERYNCVTQILYEDTARNLLFAGIDKGILAFDLNTGQEINYWTGEDGLHQNDYILSFGKDRDGQYWFGSIYGLSRFDFDKNTFYNYTKLNGKLPVEGVITIFKDGSGNMWFGTTNGLLIYDRENDHPVPVAPKELTTRVHILEEVDGGHLLVGGIDGLYLLDLNKYFGEGVAVFKIFNQNSGFQGIEPVENGSLKDSHGQIWIPCQNQVVKFNPLFLDTTVYPLKTIIASINNQPLGFTDATPSAELGYGINEIKVGFEAVGLNRPLQTEYAFRVDDGEGWSDWQTENYALLTGLGSGQHRLEAKSRTPGILEKDTPVASLLFTLDLPFWKEPHFYIYALLAIAMLAALMFFNYWRQRAYRLQAMRNERENRYLKVQTLQAQMNPHFVFNVLGTLQNLILGSRPEKANDHLVSLSVLIRRFLDASVKSEMPGRTSLENEISLEEELELIKLYIEFEQLQYEGAFDYELAVDAGLDVTAWSLPPMLIQPYIENAIRHGLLPKKEKGRLTIRIFQKKESFFCVIEDDGIGRAKAKQLQKRSLKRFKSRGTSLVERRIGILNEMGYRIDIRTEDREEGGTRVVLKIEL